MHRHLLSTGTSLTLLLSACAPNDKTGTHSDPATESTDAGPSALDAGPGALTDEITVFVYEPVGHKPMPLV